MIAQATLKKLSNDPFLGAPDGIWVQERRFDFARRLLGRGSLFHGDLPADEVRKRAVEMFDAVGRDRDAGISVGGSATYSGSELADLISWIDATAAVQVVSHLPEEDVPHPASGWVWDFYSPQRLMEFEVEVYGEHARPMTRRWLTRSLGLGGRCRVQRLRRSASSWKSGT